MVGNALIHNITKVKVNNYQMINLTPYTTYEISVAAGNKHGFGEGIISSFTTSEEGEITRILRLWLTCIMQTPERLLTALVVGVQ